MPSDKVMNHLWAVMATKFPNTWKATYSDSPFNSGLITSLASEWANQLTGLTNLEIKSGIDNLSNRAEKRFPPNAMEFKDLCTGNDFEEVLESVMCRMEDGDSYEFTSKLAFNFWKKYSFDLSTMNNFDVARLVKQNIKFFDKDSLAPLPDYTIKALTDDLKPKYDPTLRERIIFQKNMSNSITRNNPSLWLSDEKTLRGENVNQESMPAIPPLMKKIFSRDGSLNLMAKFKAGKYMVLKHVTRSNTNRMSKDEKSKYLKSIETYDFAMFKAMDKFLKFEGVLT